MSPPDGLVVSPPLSVQFPVKATVPVAVRIQRCSEVIDVSAAVAAGTASQRIVAVITVERIRAFTTDDDIVTAGATQRVVATQAVDEVGRGGAGDGIGRVGRGAERCRRSRCEDIVGLIDGADGGVVDLDRADRCQRRIPDGKQCVGAHLGLDDPRRKVGGGDARALRLIRSCVAAVPPVASKLLMISAPNPAAL